MNSRRGFKSYYLLLNEGPTESNLFAYLTKVRFKELFKVSNVQFSPKVEIINNVSQGKLGGISNLKQFKSKHTLIKKKYAGQRLFYFLDKDIEDSSKIGALIIKDNNLVQFIQYNSEYLLLKLAGKNPKNPSNFGNLEDFRGYCKREFVKQFKKTAPEFKDVDFELVFSIPTEDVVRASFSVLFSTLE